MSMRKLSSYRVHADVDLGAVKQNLSLIRGLLPEGTKLCGVVKADAYGHGAVAVSRAIEEQVHMFAVTTVDEGLELRDAGIGKPVLVLSPVFGSEFERALSGDISLTVFETENAKLLSECAGRLGIKAKVHIAVDTGMSRIGLTPDEKGLETAKEIAALPHIELAGAFTHIATADMEDNSLAYRQHDRFKDFIEKLEAAGVRIPLKHCSNSAGLMTGIGTEYDMVRAGICMYGLMPSGEINCADPGLVPAMRFVSYLTYVKTIGAGTSVSYGAAFTAKKPMRVGTVCCGYADGYPRLWSLRGGEVLLHGKRCPILGRMCMDQFMISLEDVPEAREGDEVTLIGRDGEEVLTADEIAEKTDTISYEILCNVSRRVPRIHS